MDSLREDKAKALFSFLRMTFGKIKKLLTKRKINDIIKYIKNKGVD